MFNEKRARQLLVEEFRTHPRAQLTDYYKLFFQGVFGPEHMIVDKNVARESLVHELESSERYDQPLWCDVSYVVRMFRVSLQVIKRNLVSKEDYLEAFLQSAEERIVFTAEEWTREWRSVIGLISEMSLPVSCDRENVARTLEAASLKAPVHHSSQYKENYSPHYRLLSEKQFCLLLPLCV